MDDPVLASKIRITLIVGMCAVFLAGLDQHIVNTAAPNITGELGGIDKFSWLVAAYMLTMSISTPVLAKLSDIYSRRLMMQLGIAVFVLGSLFCGLAQSMNQLIAARALQGIGGGGLFPVAIAMLGDLVSPRERGKYVARLMMAYTVGTVLGPTAGGWIVDQFGWRWAFFINLPVGAVAILMSRRAPGTAGTATSRKFDTTGLILLAGCTTSLLLALQWGGRDYAWGSPVIIGLLVGSALFLAALWRWEGRTPEAIVPPRLFVNAQFRSTMALSICAGLLLSAGPLLLPMFLQYSAGLSATNSGVLMLPLSLGLMAGSWIGGRRIAATGHYRYLVFCGFGGVLLAVLFVTTMSIDVHTAFLTAAMVVLGCGGALVGTVASTASQGAVERSDLGVANGVNLFVRNIGAMLSAAITGAMFDARLLSGLRERVPSSVLDGLDNPRALIGKPDAVRALDPPVSRAIIESIGDAVSWAFVWLVPVCALGLLVAAVMKAPPLRAQAPVTAD